MSQQPSQPAYTNAASRPEPEPLADREVRNPRLRWLVHLGVPITTSIVIHLIVFALLLIKSWYVFSEPVSTVVEYEVGITDRRDADDGMLHWPGEHELDITDETAPLDIDPFDFEPSTASLSDLARANPSGNGSDPGGAGGFGLGNSGRSGILGTGSGAGAGGGEGLGSGFGRGLGGQANVWKLRATGNNFAYVVDFSGSIIVAVDDLRRELKRSIGKLSPKQSFNVFVFYSVRSRQSERYRTESFAPNLVPATQETKQRFFQWIDAKSPQGQTNPLLAMKRALALEPDAVFLFSDGLFADDIVGEIERANRNKRAQIHCLVFDDVLLQDTSGLPRLTDGARRLKRIAEDSGGKTKVVMGADLGG